LPLVNYLPDVFPKLTSRNGPVSSLLGNLNVWKGGAKKGMYGV
jgi:hypothetical protein